PACAETLELRHFNFAQMRHYNFAPTVKMFANLPYVKSKISPRHDARPVHRGKYDRPPFTRRCGWPDTACRPSLA
ncbi:hypothetical protein, partial [Burkholderia territorii]|uniref:hypothetical protein n=1 Tax=Burkholderia territorii TaxID=1503055 RepID=UPI001E45DEE3